MKKITKKVLATVLVLALATGVFAPAAVFAAEDYEAYEQDEAAETVYEVEEQAADEADPFSWLREILGDMRDVTLTPEAMEIVLSDFDYLVNKILEVAPTQNIVYRRFGITLPQFFGIWRSIITENVPMPSILSVMEPERWGEATDDTLYIAADYLFTVLLIAGTELGGIGHLSVQVYELISQTFLALAQTVHNGIELTQEDIDILLESGVDLEYLETLIDSIVRSAQLRYDIYSTPSVLWFYGFDPSEFDLELDLAGFLGFEDPDNVTTYIIEDGRIAYLRIASFLGNMAFDSETLFPFYEEVQDFEHLIIDIRGNLGGWTNYFPSHVISMLIDDYLYVREYEMFIASEKTEAFFVNPSSMNGGVLYDIVPIAQFIAERDLPLFNTDDLALLDYVIIRYLVIFSTEDSFPFDGNIWLLVDGDSASAGDNAASMSIATGFATVVGEPTMGVTGVLYTYAALPNTGILFRIDLGYTIDQYGRSIEEYGVIPQIANAPGMDALETVLAIIRGYQLPAPQGQMLIPPPPPPAASVAVATHTAVDGIEFVSLRQEAYAHGYTVEWDGPNNSALVISADGGVRVVAVSEAGTFNDNGTVFVTVEYAARMFATEVTEQEVDTEAA